MSLFNMFLSFIPGVQAAAIQAVMGSCQIDSQGSGSTLAPPALSAIRY